MNDHWQPIDTAPKDTEVIICTAGVPFSRRFATLDSNVGWIWDYNPNQDQPTHWLHCPEVPK